MCLWFCQKKVIKTGFFILLLNVDAHISSVELEMSRLSVKIFVLLQFLVLIEASSYFTSVKRLQKLIKIDSVSFEEIKQLSANIPNKILQQKLSEWGDEIERSQKDHMEYLKNPLNEFKLIKRNTVDLSYIEKFFPDFKLNFRYGPSLPTLSDLVGAVKGLTRLQKFYQIKTKDFVDGVFGKFTTNSKLTVDDMVTIADSLSGDANGNGRLENLLALEYLELAKSKQSMNDTELCEMFVDVSNDVINMHLTEMEEQFERLTENQRDTYTEMCEEYLVKVREFTKNVNPLSEELNDAENQVGIYSAEKEAILMQKTCRGEVKKNSAEQSKLHCYYRSTSRFTSISPFKVEMVNVDPEILVFIDVLSENENSKILQLFADSTKTVDVRVKTSNETSSDWTASVTDSFNDESHEVFNRLSQRLEVSVKFCDFTKTDLNFYSTIIRI